MSAANLATETANQSTNPPAAISACGLTHRYAPTRKRRHRRGARPAPNDTQTNPRDALSGLDLAITEGEIFGVLGPNGSGKTTLFRILATLLRPSGGKAAVFGRDVVSDAALVRTALGVVFQSPSVDLKLTAHENLLHQGHLYGLRGQALRDRIDKLLEEFSLNERGRDLIERFSGGMRRRLELAKALLHQPRLLLLDEPATGLDPAARRDLWHMLKRLRADHGTTVAVTTHLMDDAKCCDRLAILHEGRLVALDTPDNLIAQIGGHVVFLDPAPNVHVPALRDTIEERFGPWDGGTAPRLLDGRVHLERPDGPQFVADLTAALPGQIRSFTVGQPTLEDVYLHLTGHTLWGRKDSGA